MDYITDFMDKMDKIFSAYAKDDCMDDYRREGNTFYVGKKDEAYVWSALDGAVHLYNLEHPDANLSLDSGCNYVTIER